MNWRSDSAQNKGSQRQGLTWEEAASSPSPGSGFVSYWFNFVFFVVDPQDSKTQELWGTATCLIALTKHNMGRKVYLAHSLRAQFIVWEGTVSGTREDGHILTIVRRRGE